MTIAPPESPEPPEPPEAPEGAPGTAPLDPATVDVIVPVYNEEETVEELLAELEALPLAVRPILVDNGSTDRTLEILRARPEVTLIEHGRDLGYGTSLRDGLAAARSERVVIIDADLEFPPAQIPDVVAALDAHDVVYASRFLGRRAGEIGMPMARVVGNRLVSGIFNLLYGQSLTDLYTGFKGLRRGAYAGLDFERPGFEFVVEMAARLARRGVRIHEVPIVYRIRRTGRSKMRHVSETAKFVALVLRYRVDRAPAPLAAGTPPASPAGSAPPPRPGA